MANDAIAGTSSGSMHLEEDLHVAGAVDPGRLDQLGRDLPHEVVQQEDRQRQARRWCARARSTRTCRARPNLTYSVFSSGISVTWIGHDLQREDRDEQDVPAREVDPGERVRRQQRPA